MMGMALVKSKDDPRPDPIEAHIERLAQRAAETGDTVDIEALRQEAVIDFSKAKAHNRRLGRIR